MFVDRNCCLRCCAMWSVTLCVDVSEEPAAPIITTIVFASFVCPDTGGRFILKLRCFCNRLHGVTSRKACSESPMWSPPTSQNMCLLELCLYLPRPIFAQCAITNEVTEFVEPFKGEDEPKLYLKIQFVSCSEDIPLS